MRVSTVLAFLLLVIFSLPLFAQPLPLEDPPADKSKGLEKAKKGKGKTLLTPDPKKVNKDDPRGLQVEPVDIKPTDGTLPDKSDNRKVKCKGKCKDKSKKKKGTAPDGTKTEKSDPHGMEVEPVDFKPTGIPTP